MNILNKTALLMIAGCGAQMAFAETVIVAKGDAVTITVGASGGGKAKANTLTLLVKQGGRTIAASQNCDSKEECDVRKQVLQDRFNHLKSDERLTFTVEKSVLVGSVEKVVQIPVPATEEVSVDDRYLLRDLPVGTRIVLPPGLRAGRSYRYGRDVTCTLNDNGLGKTYVNNLVLVVTHAMDDEGEIAVSHPDIKSISCSGYRNPSTENLEFEDLSRALKDSKAFLPPDKIGQFTGKKKSAVPTGPAGADDAGGIPSQSGM